MNSRTHRVLWVLLATLVLATPGFAEVMDKEPTLHEIWKAAGPWIAFGFVAGRVHPLLGILLLLGFLWSGNDALVALSEVHSDVGPAIRQEAGVTYVAQAYIANLLVLLSYLLGALLFLRKRRRRAQTPPKPLN